MVFHESSFVRPTHFTKSVARIQKNGRVRRIAGLEFRN